VSLLHPRGDSAFRNGGTARTHADALSLVALILVVLVFLIQIMVFIADFDFNSGRDKAASELNGKTPALLGKIDERTNTLI